MANKYLSLLKQVWHFMKIKKRWWLAPIIVILVLFGILLIFAQSSPLAPLIYTIF